MAIAQQTDRQKFPLVKYYCEEVTENFAVNLTDGQYADRRLQFTNYRKPEMFTVQLSAFSRHLVAVVV